MHGVERLDGVVDGGDAVAELVERVLLALHGSIGTGSADCLKALSDLGGIGGDDRTIGTTCLANHRGSLDVHELVVLLELAVVAALGLGAGQNARLLKERDGLIGNKGRQCVGRGLVVGKAALLGLDGPLVGVAVAGEQDALVIGQDLLAVLERSVLEFVLGRALKCIGKGLERLGHGSIEHQVGVGDVLLGAAGTELKLVAGESERGGAVAVGVVLHQLGQGVGAQVEHAARGMDGSLAVDDLLDDLGKLVAQEDRHNRRRSLVGAQTMIVAGRGNGGTQELLIVIDGLDHRGEEDDELQVVERGVARIEQVLGLGAERPVVVLTRTVDALEWLLVQQADQVMAGGDELHLLHHDQVLVDGLVDLAVDGGELMLAGSDLVVLGLGGNAERPQLVVQVLHIGRDGGADSAKVVLLELLALAGSGAKEGATGDDQVLALAVGVLLDQEVLLLVAHGRNDLLGGLAKEGENTLGLTRERGHGAQ